MTQFASQSEPVPADAQPSLDARTHLGSAQWFGQPRGLTILFLTEMWEKFSYFGMRAMLVYYMTQQLMFSQPRASLIYGLYTGAVMLTPLAGAALSDRWLGRRRAVVLGCLIMTLGHFMMAFEPLFFVALAIIAAGSGLFLPNLPSQIDGLYAATDPRRNSAFSVYYVGINTGGLLAPLVCGTIGELFGWHWGFATAGLGMVVGLLIYIGGAGYLPPEDPRSATRLARAQWTSEEDRKRAYALLLALALIVMVFRASYEQIGNTIATWIDAGVDRGVGDFTIPMTWFQSLNPLLVFTLTPLLVARWTAQAKRGKEAPALAKMASGAVLVASAWFLLSWVALTLDGAPRVSWLWVALFFALMTAGELYVFPIGLALFARITPAAFTATAIAVWYLAGFAGNLLGGGAGTLWVHLSHAQFFALMGVIAAFAAALFVGCKRFMRLPAR
ncbi:peptide MFS transporter [Peristeroidobacter agariperforans]|uniref:peptide MFS transporter n=1 Tax=Peristeroidobacter agariperforans TaxID=268404 RepID=UPI00101CA546|nr:peptide MFS transporter [Peristeroidobacter agariperforans]